MPRPSKRRPSTARARTEAWSSCAATCRAIYYLVEIFGGGRYVRAYTLDFMTRFGMRPDRLLSSCKDPQLGL